MYKCLFCLGEGVDRYCANRNSLSQHQRKAHERVHHEDDVNEMRAYGKWRGEK